MECFRLKFTSDLQEDQKCGIVPIRAILRQILQSRLRDLQETSLVGTPSIKVSHSVLCFLFHFVVHSCFYHAPCGSMGQHTHHQLFVSLRHRKRHGVWVFHCDAILFYIDFKHQLLSIFTHIPCGSLGQQTDLFFFFFSSFFSSFTPQTFCFLYRKLCGGGLCAILFIHSSLLMEHESSDDGGRTMGLQIVFFVISFVFASLIEQRQPLCAWWELDCRPWVLH